LSDKPIQYPEFRAARYGPLVTSNPRNIPMLTPEVFFLGNGLTTHPNRLYQEIASWQRFKKGPKEFKVQLFPLERDFIAWLGERKPNGQKQRRKRRLPDLSLEELARALADKVEIKDGNKNILMYHGHQDHNKRAVSRIHGASKMITAKVKHCGDKKDQDKALYHSVQIDGPYVDSVPRFNDFRCTCLDAFWSDTKRGDSNFHAICKHVAALMEYVSRNPRAFENYIRLRKRFKRDQRPLRVFTPFHTDYVRPDVMEFFDMESLPHVARGKKQPRLDHLKIDVLLAHYFENQNYADLSKKLLRLPIYDIGLVNMILNGDVVFEVMPQSQLFGVDSTVDRRVRNLKRNIETALNKEGFRIQGYCYEKRNSKEEVIAVNYLPDPEKPNTAVGEVRVLFSERYPPIILRRTPLKGARIYPFREHRTHVNPFAELYMNPEKTRRFDDRKRKYTKYTAELPNCYIPEEFLPHYANMIRQNFKGGFRRLIRMVENPDNHPNVKLPSKSLVYRMTRLK